MPVHKGLSVAPPQRTSIRVSIGRKLEGLAFTKVELWLVLLLLLLASIGGLMFGWVVQRTVRRPNGKYVSPMAVTIASVPDYLGTLLKTGARNTQIIDFDEFSGLQIEDPSLVEDGMLLVSAYSDKHRISTVYLFDLKTRVRLWEWIPNYDQIVDMTPSLIDAGGKIDNGNRRDRFRSQHPFLLDDGSILITAGEGVLAKLDSSGDVVWTNDRHFHHSIERMHDGSFVIPVVVEKHKADFRDDGYAIVSPQGHIVDERSVVNILERHGYHGLIYGVGVWEYDRTHLNDAEPILKSDEFTQKGDIVLSVKHLSTVFLYRPAEDRIIWLQTGPWIMQHDVDYLGNGLFSVFGNDWVRGRYWREHRNSNIYIYNMANGEISRPYSGLFKTRTLRTVSQGLHRILENGDAFVSLTDAHQLLRLNNQRIRWRYTSPLGEGTVGDLHWSRYFYREELDLSWLDDLKRKGDQDGNL